MPTELIDSLKEIDGAFDDIRVPMEEIANVFTSFVRETWTTGGRGAWAPLSPASVERGADDRLGFESNKSFNDLRPFARNHIAGASSLGKGVVFMERGRSWRVAPSARSRASRMDPKRLQKARQRPAEGRSYAGAEQPVREVMWVNDQTIEKAEEILVDHFFKKVNE
jgi:hypothetical protein